MNKKELIESIAHLPSDCSRPRPMIDKLTALELIELLDESQKVTVPQYVADWIEKCKSEKRRFHEALTYTPFGVNGWISNPKNQETFARAWLDEYTVEKEPKYTVKIKAVNQYLVRKTDEDFLGFLQSRLKSKFTRKELEDTGFAEAFNSPLFEVEEVTE